MREAILPPRAGSAPPTGQEGRVSDDAFRAAFHLSSEPSAFLDENGVIHLANGALGAILCQPEALLEGREVWRLVVDDEVECAQALVKDAQSWSEADARLHLVVPSGAPIPVDVRVRLFVTRAGERLLHLRARDARERHHGERLRTVALSASRAANVASSRADVGAGVLEAVHETLPEATALAFFAYDSTSGALELEAHRGADARWIEANASGLPGGLAGPTLIAEVLRAKESLFILDATLEAPSRTEEFPRAATSVIVVPALAGDTVEGALLVCAQFAERLEYEDMRCVEIAASEAASALRRIDASRRLRDLVAAIDAVAIGAPPGPFPDAALARAALEATDAQGCAYLSSRPLTKGTARTLAIAGRLPDDLHPDREPLAGMLARAMAAEEPTSARSVGESGCHVVVIPATGASRCLVLVYPVTAAARLGEAGDMQWLRLAGEELDRVTRHHEANERVRLALARERDALESVRRLNDEIQEFTLWTTHDLREPLRSLATLACALHDDAPHLAPAELERLTDRIALAADALKDRIHALHDFSRVAGEEAPLVEQDFDAVAARVVGQLSSLVTERGAHVTVEPARLRLRAQAGRLECMLLNLVENAVKYGNPKMPVVRVRAREVRGGVEVSVEDNGSGVGMEARERVFRLFYRAPEHQAIPGGGMGLAIVRRIASQHGGDVRVEDGAMGGARFVVHLPGALVEEAPAAPLR